MADTPQNAVAANQAPGSVPEGRLRNILIVSSIGLLAAIVFGLLYLFIIAPAIPGSSLGWFLFSFATGLTMIVLPCTLPLAFVIVPLSMGKGLVRGLGMALAFGLGIATTLSLYGVAAALIGNLAIDALGAPLESVKNWVYFIAGIFALLFALSEIGLLNFHMPTYSGAAPAFIQKRQEILKAFFLGLFLGNVGVGCPHPATPLILIEIASSGDIFYGWLMFLVHAIGRILPLLLLAFLGILGVNGLSWLMARKEAVERTTGWAMVFVAGFILTLGLFSHDWWVNSGLHSGLETLTQEHRFNILINDTLGTNVAHVHGLEEGEGLFGLPLGLGSWVLVALWLVPIWWWWNKRRSHLLNSPSFRLQAIEKKLDALERDRRQVESMVDLDAKDPNFDLAGSQAQLDALEEQRRRAEEHIQYGETGKLKNPVAREYELRALKTHRNYLAVISIFLILVFVHFLPTNFVLKAGGGGGHDDHGGHGDHGAVAVDTGGHDHGAHDHGGGAVDTTGIHAMADGTVMNAKGEILKGAHVMPDGSFMLADGSTVGNAPARLPGTPFTTSIIGLPEANAPETVELEDGDTYDITASYVQKEVGNRTLRMLAYNGSVPGPFIKAPQGAVITINFTNNTDINQTIHSHGIRINNRFDGVPDVTQDTVRPGESFVYKINFPDAGVFWYHPHTRDDYGQELGLYGNYIVDPSDSDYWAPVNREVPLVIDDILIENDRIADFYKEFTNHALLGRFGNEYLVNGEKDFTMTARKGEVIRFFVTNVSNARTYNLSIPGATMKIVGADLGRFEREVIEKDFLISPAERVVIEAFFNKAGTYKLTHTTPDKETEIARVLVTDDEVATSYAEEFEKVRVNEDVIEEFKNFRDYLAAAPDKNVLLTIDLSGATVDHSAHAHHDTAPAIDHSQHAHAAPGGDRLSGIQWDDPNQSDRTNVTPTILWKMIDQDTGRENMNIDWTFRKGDLVKVRLTNDANAGHVMQHPIHFHGQQFVVLAENGTPNENMAWKDTVLVFPGETVDILVDMSNPGVWMSHCHISEHLHAGMMLGFRVNDVDGSAPGDDYRATVPAGAGHSMPQSGSAMEAMKQAGKVVAMRTYSFAENIKDAAYEAVSDSRFYRAGRKETVVISFFDQFGTPVGLDDTLDNALNVTFVRSDDTVSVFTYPGNTDLADPIIEPQSDGHTDHIHFLGIPTAYAHGDEPEGHTHNTTLRTYSVPVVFPAAGAYRAYVEFTVDGETEPRVTTFDVEVARAGLSIDNFGWSKDQKWWILLIISLLLMAPLSYGVHRYLNNIK